MYVCFGIAVVVAVVCLFVVVSFLFFLSFFFSFFFFSFSLRILSLDTALTLIWLVTKPISL